MTIEDPPWKKRTRPCPFYSQGRCLFAHGCNFMHAVKIRRPDSVAASEDSDQPDFRLLVDSPTPSKSGRVRSPHRSPRRHSLLLALGSIIQLDEEDGEWEEEDSGEQESLSGEGSLEGRQNADHADADDGATPTSLSQDEMEHPLLHSDAMLDNDARPTPFLAWGEDQGTASESHSLSDGSPKMSAHPSTALEALDGQRIEMHHSGSLTSDLPVSTSHAPISSALSPRHAVVSELKSSFRTGPLSSHTTSLPLPSRLVTSSDFFTRRASIEPDLRLPSFSAPVISDTQPPSPPSPESTRSHHRSSNHAPSQLSSLRRDSVLSDLLSPIDITPSLPIGFPRRSSFVGREDSFDSGYAEGPQPLRTSPPRSPRRISTLSILSSPFGSPSARVLYGGAPSYSGFDVAPAAALFSPRFGAFPTTLTQDRPDNVDDASARHSRNDSVDSILLYQEPSFSGSQFEDADELEIQIEEPAILANIQRSSLTGNQNLEESSHFALMDPSRYMNAGDDLLRVGEASFGSEDSMASIYDEFFTPTVHSKGLDDHSDSSQYPGASSVSVLDSYTQDSSPLVASSEPEATPLAVIGAPTASPSWAVNSSVFLERVSEQSDYKGLCHGQPTNITTAAVPTLTNGLYPADPPAWVTSPSSEVSRVFSPQARPSSALSSGQMRKFSLPSSAHNSASVIPSRSVSPALSIPEDLGVEGSIRSSSLLGLCGSEHGSQSGSSAEPGTRKVPFGFRHSVTGRSQTLRRRPDSLLIASRAPSPALVESNMREELQLRPQTPLSPVQETSSTASATSSNRRRLKPLRLSMLLGSASSSGASVPPSSSIPSLTTATTDATALTPSSPTVSSEYSLSNHRLLSSPRSRNIPSHSRIVIGSSQPNSPSHIRPVIASSSSAPASAPAFRPPSWQNRFSKQSLFHRSSRLSFIDHTQFARSDSRLSEPINSFDERQEDEYNEYEDADQADETIRRPLSADPVSNSSTFTVHRRRDSMLPMHHAHRESLIIEPVHAIATPRPTLLFALASDNVEEVRRVLESGEARPNDDVGPQSALAFTLANNQLKSKTQMVKLLLSYGADTSVLRDPEDDERPERSSKKGSGRLSKVLENLDPATRYYVERADSPQTRRTSALIHRSYFRPLARVRYDLVGQDRVLEQLFRVLSMPSLAPIVVLLCGPSGHGKSLLARKFGSLLEVPTHTVNMTTLQNTSDIWKSHSISPHEAPPDKSLKEFLIENEGKRCVVVLDEIEKTQDEKFLSSLLMPWEYGRCSFEAGHRHVDVSKVVWLGTSNIGHDLVFGHQENRRAPETQLSREEYVDLMGLLRPRVSARLGPSLLSRVTAVLPFLAFTTDEKMAIAAEALQALAGDAESAMPPATRDMIVRTSLKSYIPSEGARSLYRAVSTLLLDTI